MNGQRNINVLLNGAGGRMGGEIVKEIEKAKKISLWMAFDREDHLSRGKGISVGCEVIPQTYLYTYSLQAAKLEGDVIIDFSTPEAAIEFLTQICKPAVIGVTGFTNNQLEAIEAFSKKVPIVQDYNFSTGACIVTAVAEMIAHGLGADCDVDILEVHHGMKVDAPSGTAIKLAKAIANARGQKYGEVVRMERVGKIGPRPQGEIGIQALRLRGVIGEHTIHFASPHERIDLNHKVGSRAVFAQGAVTAAEWVVDKPPGLYTMRDVLGL